MQSDGRIRILFCYANTSELGGADYCMLSLATALDPKKFDVHIALGRPCSLAEQYEAARVQVHYVPMVRLQQTKNPIRLVWYLLKSVQTVLALLQLIHRFQIDIVHSNDLLDFYGSVAARLLGRSAVQHIRMILTSRGMWSVVTRLALFLNQRVIVVSDGVKTAAFHKATDESAKVVRIYDWLTDDFLIQSEKDSTLRAELGFDEKCILIGSVGRLQFWKGQHLFIKAAALLAEEFSDVRFAICGSVVAGRGREQYENELRELAACMHIQEKLVFLGHRRDIPNVMKGLDIFVHTSVTPEPFGLVNLEASACGIPVVAANAGGVPEIVVDTETGFLYEPGNVAELAAKVRQLILIGREGRMDMGRLGKQYVGRVFDGAVQLHQFETLYESILPRRKESPKIWNSRQ